ncbi:MAG: PD-(D/E)XK nuclease family protein, partial [Candidatus Dormibacteraceae bacterium]
MTIEEPHWSYSSYDEYMLCGHRYKLRRVDGVPSKPSMAAVGGSAFHKWTELYDGCRIDYDPHWKLSIDDWENCFLIAVKEQEEKSGLPYTQFKVSGKVTKATPNKEDYDWWLIGGWDMCCKYVDWRSKVNTTIATDLPPDEDGNTIGIEWKLNVE